MVDIGNFYKDKVVLVTGGAGSIGSELVKKLLELKPKVVRILDNNETGLFDLKQELKSEKMRILVGDVRDKERLKRAIEGVDIILHAAALKHVPLCEYNPFEAVKTNVLGTQNIIEVVMDEEVEKLITISTDKVVNPINVLGATKLLAERLTISASYYKGLRKTAFSCVRFGNVLDSRGSVVPVVRSQIKNGGPVTITDPDMIRFVMSIPQAIELILRASTIAKGGEIFILKMPAIRISDLIEVMIQELAPKFGYKPEEIKIEMVGRRHGEKMYEELMTEDEASNASFLDEMFVVFPRIAEGSKIAEKYTSKNEKLLDQSEIKIRLQRILSLR